MASPADGLHDPLPVTPGRPGSDFAVDPYPGTRPAGSWVMDRAERCWPVVPDEGMPSGWAVVSSPVVSSPVVSSPVGRQPKGRQSEGRQSEGRQSEGRQPEGRQPEGRQPEGRQCLDAWLAGQGASRVADRVPLLSYGSNACPGKVIMNGTPLPVVNLACEMAGLASVWCTGLTRAGRLPATLAAVPEHSETAVVTLADAAELARLDVVEGRTTGWYALQILHTGRVTLENGARVPRPAAYVGARPERHPALVDGRFALRAATPVLVPAGAGVPAPVPAGAGTGAPGRGAPVAVPGPHPQPIGDDVEPGTYPDPGDWRGFTPPGSAPRARPGAHVSAAPDSPPIEARR
ncbi:hypothetical protein [Actinoplanes sp. GCM10030250]|uniref:hypothetical protein n=1 Tax=Actinoplanes sp. GCM10030250 TaxID=3273376 RepID=UPI00360FC5C6